MLSVLYYNWNCNLGNEIIATKKRRNTQKSDSNRSDGLWSVSTNGPIPLQREYFKLDVIFEINSSLSSAFNTRTSSQHIALESDECQTNNKPHTHRHAMCTYAGYNIEENDDTQFACCEFIYILTSALFPRNNHSLFFVQFVLWLFCFPIDIGFSDEKKKKFKEEKKLLNLCCL